MGNHDEQFDYPVKLEGHHVAYEPVGHEGDKFKCHSSGAYTHTGAWPTFDFCPWCGAEL